jgi:hypothetical protein
MTEMYIGETVIKVMPAKVDEMLRKGWLIVAYKAAEIIESDEPVVDSEEIIHEDDSEEE